LSGIPVRQLLVPAGFRRSYYISSAVRSARLSGYEYNLTPNTRQSFHWQEPGCRIEFQPDGSYHFQHQVLADTGMAISYRKSAPGIRLLELGSPDRQAYRRQMFNSNVLTLDFLPFRQLQKPE